jgi:hypothetical protein
MTLYSICISEVDYLYLYSISIPTNLVVSDVHTHITFTISDNLTEMTHLKIMRFLLPDFFFYFVDGALSSTSGCICPFSF